MDKALQKFLDIIGRLICVNSQRYSILIC